jgi:hypothetical protein
MGCSRSLRLPERPREQYEPPRAGLSPKTGRGGNPDLSFRFLDQQIESRPYAAPLRYSLKPFTGRSRSSRAAQAILGKTWPAHVGFDFVLVAKVVGDDRVNIGKAQRVAALDNGFGRATVLEPFYYDFQVNPRITDTNAAVFLERQRQRISLKSGGHEDAPERRV